MRGSSGPITFTGLAYTKRACAEALATLEMIMTAVLSGTVEATVTAGRLRLTHPSGRGLGLQAEGP